MTDEEYKRISSDRLVRWRWNNARRTELLRIGRGPRLLGITGSRKGHEGASSMIESLVRIAIHRYGVDGIVHGGADGPDLIADRVALDQGLISVVLRPDYSAYQDRPKYAPIARNTVIVERCALLISFWNGDLKSGGTLDATEKARLAGKLAHVYLAPNYEDINDPERKWK